MSTIYLVNGRSGIYDSKTDWTVRAELTREAAERHIALCLHQLEKKFDKYFPYSDAMNNFTIPADPQVTLAPYHAASTPDNWWDHGVRYEVVPVELNDGATSSLMIHRCGKPNV